MPNTSMQAELALALSRLMAASQNVVPVDLTGPAGEEYIAAREQAARSLVNNRARCGRPWITGPDTGSFFDRWRTLRGEGTASQDHRPLSDPLG